MMATSSSMRGSIREVRWLMGGPSKGYHKVRDTVAGKSWYIVGFSATSFVLRIEDDNIEFERVSGKIKQRVSLSRGSR